MVLRSMDEENIFEKIVALLQDLVQDLVKMTKGLFINQWSKDQ